MGTAVVLLALPIGLRFTQELCHQFTVKTNPKPPPKEQQRPLYQYGKGNHFIEQFGFRKLVHIQLPVCNHWRTPIHALVDGQIAKELHQRFAVPRLCQQINDLQMVASVFQKYFLACITLAARFFVKGDDAVHIKKVLGVRG
jgi:hypothetical protein